MSKPTPELLAHRQHAAAAQAAAQAAHGPAQPPVERVTDVPMTGASALVRSLEALGVDTVFGIPGGAILPAYDPLFDSKVRHILVRHEQGAGHAATGYAQATGRVGVCMATSGPGATNLVTPIADAYMDSVPIVAITGQVGRPYIGTDAFQEADIQGITLPITKHNFLVQNAEELPRIMAEAFHLAATGRPGPVLVDIAKSAMQSQTTFSWPQELTLLQGSIYENLCMGDKQLSRDDAVRALREAGAYDFVMSLPQQLDTDVGQMGMKLSGGQRQRISLARALVRRPRLLILDDATSAVDPEVEARILGALRSGSGDASLVVVAYRKATIGLADEVVYLADGRVADRGPHVDLLARNPAYARLVNAYEQAREAVEAGDPT